MNGSFLGYSGSMIAHGRGMVIVMKIRMQRHLKENDKAHDESFEARIAALKAMIVKSEADLALVNRRDLERKQVIFNGIDACWKEIVDRTRGNYTRPSA